MKRVRVALNPPRTVHDFAVFARVVALRLSEDPLFSPPPALLAALNANLAALDVALPASLTRSLGAASERKAKQRDVLTTLQGLQSYVQSVANTLPYDEAVMVAKRAGMDVKDAKGPSKAALAVKRGRVSGTAHAYVKAAKGRAGYEWQVQRDDGAWESIPFTTRADVELGGLVPGALIHVRARSKTKAGPSDWFGPVTYRVG